MDAYTGVMQTDPVEDVHLIGAFDDDIVLQRNYASGRQHGGTSPTGPVFIGSGWAHNLQVRIIDDQANNIYAFIREDGQGYRFDRSDLSDATGKGWSLVRGGGGSGFVVTAADGRQYTLDASGRLVSRRTRTGALVQYAYDGGGNLTTVSNASGQTIYLGYVNGRVDRIRLGSSSGTLLARYIYSGSEPNQLDRVCYTDACDKEDYTYVYGGGAAPGLLLTQVSHGGVLLEAHQYDTSNKVIASSTSSATLSFTYGHSCGGTYVQDLDAPPGDPWASTCISFDPLGRVAYSTHPTGCRSDVSSFQWGAAGHPSLAEARPISTSVGGGYAWTTTTYNADQTVNSRVENAPGFSSTPPPGVTRTTTYTYESVGPSSARWRLPMTVTRDHNDNSCVSQAKTTLTHDDYGHETDRVDVGCTNSLDSGTPTAQAFSYASHTDYETNVPLGMSRPIRLAGPDEGARVNHTELYYYGANGEGFDGQTVAARANRLGKVTKCASGFVAQPGTCYDSCWDTCYDSCTGQPYDCNVRNCNPHPCPGTCQSGSYVETEYLSYDAFGRPTEVVNSGGARIAFSYDNFGRLLARALEAGLSGWSEQSWYDAAGRLWLYRNQSGSYVHYYYANDGLWSRLKAITKTATAPANPTALTAGAERTEYYYDAQGNATREAAYRDVSGSLLTGTCDRDTRRTYIQGRVKQEQVLRGGALRNAAENTYDPSTGELVTRVEHGDGGSTLKTTYAHSWDRLVRNVSTRMRHRRDAFTDSPRGSRRWPTVTARVQELSAAG
ncbi:MAG TPA: DUF6531 domain-containing protein [Polyangia bacterium]